MLITFETTASFDVDPQKGFTPLCPEELPVEGGHDIVAALNQQATFARLRVFSKDAHPANPIWAATHEAPPFSPVKGEDVDVRWNLHCVPGTRGFQLLDGLPPIKSYDFAVYKGIEPDMHPYGACFHDLKDTLSTGVIEFLKQQGIDTVICGGLATDHCVRLTVLQLLRADFQVVLNLEACRGISSTATQQALAEMKAAGARIIHRTNELCNSI
ncbi:nicotinamidase [Aestuariicella hydrocarbonica]|uniref:nicotinamidase n=1 Tax=Pseudomaricurvus hydrocarbonicus TaxID=1470433 RepID=A0A9E5MK88_9GAMM|nr:nicotinamidase [Aestuariicella hydrocarbonica]NHO66174.1 nicotinamidase [Aestuariicella hydrocarbonica]